MSALSDVRAVPRVVVGGYFRVVRLPLTAVERLTGQRSNALWPPALAYEGFEAGVETALGGWLRDPVLAGNGRLRQAKVAQLRRSVELDAAAAQEREEAEERLAHEREQAEAEAQEAERRAEQRERNLERVAEQREEKIRAKNAQKQAAAREAEASAAEALDRSRRVTKAAALKKETQAIAAKKRALEAEKTVDVISATLDESRATD